MYWQVNTLATMFMIAVAVQMAKNMFELGFLLDSEPDDAETKLRWLNIGSFAFFAIVLGIEIYLSIFTVNSTNDRILDVTFKKTTYGVLLFLYCLVSCLLVAGYTFMFKNLSKYKDKMLKR